MDIAEIVQLIANFGFPIVLCVYLLLERKATVAIYQEDAEKSRDVIAALTSEVERGNDIIEKNNELITIYFLNNPRPKKKGETKNETNNQ